MLVVSYWKSKISYSNYNSKDSVIKNAKVGGIVQWRDAKTGEIFHATIVTEKTNSTIKLTFIQMTILIWILSHQK